LKYIKTGLTFDPSINQIVKPREIRIDASRLRPGEREALEAGTIDPTTLTHAMVQEPQRQPHAGDPGRKYFGEVATGYDARREDSDKWKVEQEIIERMLSDFPAGSWVLDAPCGTGRFFPLYEAKRFVVRGVDISPDMLRVAGEKIKDPTRIIDDEKASGWRVANIIEAGTGLDESSVDVSVSIRFTRWVMGKYGPEGIKKLLAELQRVSRGKVIFTARVKDHPNCVPPDLIQASLSPGWAIHEDAPGYEDAYRIIALGPAA